MAEIPVYVISGFLESGKTTFLSDTIQDKDFLDGGLSLLITCEDGEVEYDENELQKLKVKKIEIEEEEDLTEEFMLELQKTYRPARVLIEYNGMWNVGRLINEALPNPFTVVQIITLVDATTFEVYMNNMRSLMAEQFKITDMVIFNRCTDQTNQSFCRRNVKAVNRRAQVFFEGFNGEEIQEEPEELPFDTSGPVITLEDEDFGLWYVDALDNLDNYVGKTIKFRGYVYKPDRFPKGVLVPGRFAMTCCADDVAFIGFICQYKGAENFVSKQWVNVTAEIGKEYQKEYKGEGPVLYAKSIVLTGEPKEKLVYFS
ncbi:TIGR03943 family putative permease subunit [Anaerosporobacter faecicola]|uniref:TIGR03943 family putative permease subunit n=1 Tax=Anaerosporobacter faecicola TaxID=2718714 RepID=UPI00143BFC77|nr:GTP-binding protein [Anaerosporobacter faecicola]